jgi:hypothetical protein
MNLCNFAEVIISRCTKDASTINWWNDNACSSDDLKLDIPAHSQLITTQTRHALYHTFMEKYPKMQISFEKFKFTLPRIQKYITNSTGKITTKMVKRWNLLGYTLSVVGLNYLKMTKNNIKLKIVTNVSQLFLMLFSIQDLLQKAQQSYMKCAPVFWKFCEVNTHQPARTPTKELSKY